MWLHVRAWKSFPPSASFVSQHGIMYTADWAWRDSVATLNMRTPTTEGQNGGQWEKEERRWEGGKKVGDIVNNVHRHAERQRRYSGN